MRGTRALAPKTTGRPLFVMAASTVAAAALVLGIGVITPPRPSTDATDISSTSADGRPLAPPGASDDSSPQTAQAAGSTTDTTVPDPAVTSPAAAGPPGAGVVSPGEAEPEILGERLFLPGWLPDGFQPDGGVNTIDAHPPVGRVQIFRDPKAPLGSPALLTVTTDAADPTGPPWLVRHLTPENTGLPAVMRLVIQQPADVTVYAIGVGMNEEGFRSLASTVTSRSNRAGDGVAVGVLPAGFMAVADSGDAEGPVRRRTLYYAIGHGAQAPEILLEVADTRQLSIELLPFLVTGTFSPTSIRGHDGFAVHNPGGAGEGLVWQESATEVVSVGGFGVSLDSLRRFVENLEPIAAAEWAGKVGLREESTDATQNH
jgi:hypothetical protein